MEFSEDIYRESEVCEELLTTSKLLSSTYLKIKGVCLLKALKFRCLKKKQSHFCLFLCYFTQCLEGAFYLYEKGIGEEVSFTYLKLAQSLEEYIGKTFNEWVVTVEKELARHLETPLMAKLHNNRYMYVHDE